MGECLSPKLRIHFVVFLIVIFKVMKKLLLHIIICSIFLFWVKLLKIISRFAKPEFYRENPFGDGTLSDYEHDSTNS